jgi:ferredoxin
MGINIEPLKCTACGMCEVICGYHWDDAFSMTSSSIVTYRMQEKRNYFGLMLKTEEDLILGRPEGVVVQRLGSSQQEQKVEEEDEGVVRGPASKPILLRAACDMCKDFEGPLCVACCPTGCLSLE